MMHMTVRRLPGLVALVLCLFASASALAQTPDLVIHGRVVGADNAGVAGQRVVLHRVDASGGATIAETVSGEDGRFELRTPATADTTGVYFVAARYDEELYIGPPFRPTDPLAAEQVIQVGIPSMSATSLLADDGAGAMPVGRGPPQSRAWLLLIVPLLGVTGVVIYMVSSGRRIPRYRALLIQVAELDERMSTASAAQRASLQDERLRLMARLRDG